MDRTGFNVYLSFRKYVTRMLETQGEMVRECRGFSLIDKKRRRDEAIFHT